MKRKRLITVIFVEIFLIMLTIFLYNPFLKLSLIGSSEINLMVGSDYTDQGVIASYFNKDILSEVVTTGEVDTTRVGNYEIKYVLKKGSATRNLTRIVKVVDLIKPIITLNGQDEYILCGKEFAEPGFTATDNYDGNITKNVEVVKKSDEIIYKVKDSSGNETIATRKLTNKDTIGPDIKLIGSDILTFKLNGKYVEYGVTATDNCSDDVTSKVAISSDVDMTKAGTYQVTYKAIDESNNESQATRKIIIYNEQDINKGYNEIVNGPTYIKSILIVNKKYSIPSTFGGENAEATAALKELQKGATEAGYNLPLKSGYRSYATQASLYNNYVNNYGLTYANSRSAKAGHSEHQTGLSFDIGVVSTSFGSTDAGKWLAANCYKYGFIIRYPENKELITGYNYEPWHVRYVGINVATEIMQKNITLEEYLGVYK